MADEKTEKKVPQGQKSAPERSQARPTVKVADEPAEPQVNDQGLTPEEVAMQSRQAAVDATAPTTHLKSLEATVMATGGAPLTAVELSERMPNEILTRPTDLEVQEVVDELAQWAEGERMISNRRVGDLVHRWADLVQPANLELGNEIRSTLMNPIGSEGFLLAIRRLLKNA